MDDNVLGRVPLSLLCDQPTERKKIVYSTLKGRMKTADDSDADMRSKT